MSGLAPLVMDGTAPQPSYAELAAVVIELQSEIVQLKTRIEELEKKNPTQMWISSRESTHFAIAIMEHSLSNRCDPA